MNKIVQIYMHLHGCTGRASALSKHYVNYVHMRNNNPIAFGALTTLQALWQVLGVLLYGGGKLAAGGLGRHSQDWAATVTTEPPQSGLGRHNEDWAATVRTGPPQ